MLQRLLLDTGLITKPFRTEGDEFWGNIPPFSPGEAPAGTLYQQYNGTRGHLLTADDATPDVVALMTERLHAIECDTPLMLAKSPYNTVRIPWLKKVFPNACIVAMVRDPVANVFSLLKKFHPHDDRGAEPEEGWWGVKPPQWTSLRRTNIVEQCALQWLHVNTVLVDNLAHVDCLIPYAQLCDTPATFLGRIFDRMRVALDIESLVLPSIQCFDKEFAIGSRLRSKNRYWRERGRSLETPATETIEINALAHNDMDLIQRICEPAATRLRGEA